MTAQKNNHSPRIAIVGGGVSGSLVAIYLSQNPHFKGKITLVEGVPQLTGKGIAYTGTLPYQPLNVIARNMSVWTDKPNDFVEWLTEHGHSFSPTDFAPRNIYGQYFKERMSSVLVGNPNVEIVAAEVKNVSQNDHLYELETSIGNLIADSVVLCLGNTPQQKTDPTASPNYIGNPWDHSAFNEINEGEHALIVGTGLTMVDWAVSLLEKGVKVTAVSRRGLLPRAHLPSPLHLEHAHFPEGNLSDLFKFFRNKLQNEATEERPWQALFDTVREDTARAWRGLSAEEKRRFMRHVRPYWEVHRHRMPVASAEKLAHYESIGHFAVKQSRVKSISSDQNGVEVELLTKDGNISKNHFDWAINCTGPDASFPLLNLMAEQGLVELDIFKMGINLDERCCSTLQQNIYAMGNVSRGSFWEATAMRELRQQAQMITDELVETYKAESIVVGQI